MRVMPYHTIQLKSPVDIYLMKGILSDAGEIIRSYIKGNRALIITDNNVDALYGKQVEDNLLNVGFKVSKKVITSGEASKNMDTIVSLYDSMNASEIGRGDVVIALGGGVVGDIAGFASATYMRGIPYVQIPTTMLAQIDSSVGGKTGVDLPYGKNLAGSFYQPKAIIIDPILIKTLSCKVMNDGIAEAIKYGLISDEWIFETLSNGYDDEQLAEIIRRSVLIKAHIVEQDENESSLRMILNFGHTYGHAIEKCMNYKGIMHGAAVGIGMVYAAKIGLKLGITDEGVIDKIKSVLTKYNLPIDMDISIEQLNNAIMSDKKRSGDKINFVILEDIGQAVITKIAIDDLKAMKL